MKITHKGSEVLGYCQLWVKAAFRIRRATSKATGAHSQRDERLREVMSTKGGQSKCKDDMFLAGATHAKLGPMYALGLDWLGVPGPCNVPSKDRSARACKPATHTCAFSPIA
jgi:hypothetical protein